MAGLGVGCSPRGEPGSLDHVVLVMMENRTFDHYFGSLSLVEGRDDIDGLRPEHFNPHPDGSPVHPFRSEHHCPLDPPHGWNTSHAQFDDGTNLKFVEVFHQRWGSQADPGLVMGYHDRSQLPTLYAMADSYALCQHWYASLMTSTWPNRFYSHGGQNQGIRSNHLPSGATFYEMRTLWDQLDEAGISWAYYYSDLPFLALFGRYSQRDELRVLDDFFVDCARGTLPQVCMVEPFFSWNDDHPPHHPMLGQVFLGSIHNALAASPLWERCMMVINYDEHGGFFDHVPPPKVPDDFAETGFDQLGFRVPAVVAGPWVRQGHVSSVHFDHTSPLSQVQHMFGLEPLTTRNAAANDLESLIDRDRIEANDPAPPATLPVIELSREEIEAQCQEAMAYRATGQPELARFVEDCCPRWMDRREDIERTSQQLLDRAEALGICRIG